MSDNNEAHNKGQEDAAEDKHDPPHGLMDFFINSFNPFNYSEAVEKMNEENEAYEAGHDHASSQK